MKKKARAASTAEPKSTSTVPINRIFLMLDNPRHEPLENESKVMARLCAKENILPLARDIVKNGLNPLEQFALIPKTGSKKTAAVNYYVAEGNRRVCALKLLNDPELAPPELRKSFAKAAESWEPIRTVKSVIFDEMESVQLWLERIHAGSQGGVGRKEWAADQKQRFYGTNKNRAAQVLLDYAQTEGMISAQDREGKLTTVQRFLSNESFRERLGLDTAVSDNIARIRPKTDFDILVKRFIQDLVDKGRVNSRMNKDEIVQYGRSLGSLPGVTNAVIEAEPLSTEEKTTKMVRRKKPKRPEKARHVQYEPEIADALKNLKNKKLQDLYHSICDVDLEEHVLLVGIGVWVFFETLTAVVGRNEGTSFDAFLSKSTLDKYGLSNRNGATREALQRVNRLGNVTKHHGIAAMYDRDQLNNDMATLKPLIIKCTEHAIAPKR